jgi:deoxyribonucleoside regulator
MNTVNSVTYHNLSDEEYRLCIRVSLLYYENNLTQDEIGKLLGYSRVKINRVLRQSRDAGIVEIRVSLPTDTFYRLEDDLLRKYSLRDVRIVESAEPGQDLYLSLARGVAGWLSQTLTDGMYVGISHGRTVSYLPQVFRIDHPIDCTFTEVVGAASENLNGEVSYNVTTKLADLAGGRAELFYAPTFVSNPELKKKLIAEPSIAAALKRARQCQIILQSVGPLDESALMFNFGQLNVNEMLELHQIGAVGDAMGHFYDANGNHVKTFMDDRVIGLDLEDLHNVPWSVLVAGGSEKIKPIDSALRGKLFNVLITDDQTAKTLLEEKLHAE